MIRKRFNKEVCRLDDTLCPYVPYAPLIGNISKALSASTVGGKGGGIP